MQLQKRLFSITETIKVYDKLQNELRWYINIYIYIHIERVIVSQEEFILNAKNITDMYPHKSCWWKNEF